MNAGEQTPRDDPGGEEDREIEPRRDIELSWETAHDELSEMALIEVLNNPAIRADLDVANETRQQIRLHEAPPGFRAIMGKLADELFVSYSGLARVSLGHGLSILESQSWIRRVRSAYEHARREGMERGGAEALDRLSLGSRHTFRQPRPISTTLDASRATAARLSDLAMVCGTPRPTLAVIAVAISLLTLENYRGYRAILQSEVDAFKRFVVRRTSELRFEDGT